MIDLLGLVAALAFGACAVPQAWQAWRTKSSQGISPWFLALWITGEVTMTAYVLLTSRDPYLLLNYGCNGACLSVITYYKVKE